MYPKRTAIAVLAGLVATAPVWAQTKTAQVTPAPPAGSKQVIPEKQRATVQSGRSESLSKTLSNSGGVIKPAGNVDPGMNVPAPNPETHTTPVIPPSATGGGTAK